MTRNEYEQRKRRLEEQLRSGIELLETAFRAQVRALDLVWMLQEEEDGSTGAVPASVPQLAAPLPPPKQPRRRSAPEVNADVRAALSRLPETFTRTEVCEALGYEPDRGTLYRCLEELIRENILKHESLGAGQRATIYRKAGGDDSP